MRQPVADIDSISALFERGTYFDFLFPDHKLGYGMPGVEGELTAQTLQSDLCILGMLVVSFLLICIVLHRAGLQILQDAKGFFTERTRGNLFVEDTGNSFSYTPLLVINTSLLAAISAYALFFYPLQVGCPLQDWQILLGGMALFLLYYMVKYIVYAFVNWVFFHDSKRKRWMEIYSLVISLQGILFFPIVCFLAYFQLDIEKAATVLIFIVFLAKILLFYKGVFIFFPNFHGALFNILYFCTLEMIPVLFLLKFMSEFNLSWTINI